MPAVPFAYLDIYYASYRLKSKMKFPAWYQLPVSVNAVNICDTHGQEKLIKCFSLPKALVEFVIFIH